MNRPRKFFRIGVFLSIFALLFTGIIVETGAQRTSSGDERLLEQALVTGVTMGIPGISAAVGVGDSTAWSGTAGFNDILRRIPIRADDRFCVGSITKTFVARVILQQGAR